PISHHPTRMRKVEGRVVGAHEIVPELVATEGTMTETAPRKSDWRDLDAAHEAAKAIGALDIGQAAVAIGGRAIALEGVEGTDGLLERTKQLRGHGRLAGRTRGVLVKCAKPDQEMRADLPSIGPQTIEAAHAAGLAGIGVEAGRSLVLEASATIERANALGLFIIGLPAAEPAHGG
ncbi:MAG: UDP-2,3-diacylglucosamine diphosphatase LpxI, partial [Mesorhizobium sp.]